MTGARRTLRSPRAAAGAFALLLVLAATAVPTAAPTPGLTPTIFLTDVFPSAVGSSGTLAVLHDTTARGDQIFVRGIAYSAPRRALAALEQSTPAGWEVVARSALQQQIHGKRFALQWSPQAVGPTTVRVAVRLNRRDLAVTGSQTTRVLQTRCTAPTQPRPIPPGDGWIVGGLYAGGPYLSGGPFGEIIPPANPTGCDWLPYTITVAAVSGQPPRATVATQTVQGDQSYAIALTPGRYTLEATYEGKRCVAGATVTAGEQLWVDTLCNVEDVP